MVDDRLAFELEIVAALRDDGSSTREVAKDAGLSNGRIIDIARKHGWPDQTELDRRAAEKAEREANPLGIREEWS